jgi:hypothetical protein
MVVMNIENIIHGYERYCNSIAEAFAEKQDLEFDGWVGDTVGGVAGFIGQYFFSPEEMILDLSTQQPKGLILEWQDSNIEACIEFEKREEKFITYKAYIGGIRH